LLSVSGTNTSAAEKAAHETQVAERVSTLLELAMDNSKASLDTILSELTNSDSQIRRGALEATIQYASRDAIPRLAEVAGQTEDVQEKAALNDAIEFLKLPSLTEIVEANKGLAPPRIMKAARPGVPTTRPPATIQQ
jgi:HEAT repeat protein